MTIQLNGLGAWIWQPNQCDHGNFQQTVVRCKNIGTKWIAIKMGDNDPYSFFTQSKIQELKQICNDNGMNLCGWNYSLPDTTSRQINTISSLIDYGVEGWIIDAETEWEFHPNNDQCAEEFLSQLRIKIGNEITLAHAPFAMIDYHIKFPYSVFGKYCNYSMPQCYNSQFNWTMEYSVQLMDQFWNKFFSYHPEISSSSYCPIMASYGNEYPGVKGTLTSNDIQVFVNHYKLQPNISFYSVDAANQTFWNTMQQLNAALSSIAPNIPIPNILQPSLPIVINSTPQLPSPPINQPQTNPATNVPPSNSIGFLEWVINMFQQILGSILENFKK